MSDFDRVENLSIADKKEKIKAFEKDLNKTGVKTVKDIDNIKILQQYYENKLKKFENKTIILNKKKKSKYTERKNKYDNIIYLETNIATAIIDGINYKINNERKLDDVIKNYFIYRNDLDFNEKVELDKKFSKKLFDIGIHNVGKANVSVVSNCFAYAALLDNSEEYLNYHNNDDISKNKKTDFILEYFKNSFETKLENDFSKSELPNKNNYVILKKTNAGDFIGYLSQNNGSEHIIINKNNKQIEGNYNNYLNIKEHILEKLNTKITNLNQNLTDFNNKELEEKQNIKESIKFEIINNNYFKDREIGQQRQ